MTEVMIYRLLDLGFNLLSLGLEREGVIAKVRELETSGATPAEVDAALRKMRDDAIAALRAAVRD